jgi:phosphopantothenoylcysteine decarboxylase/phosphopantothenate--cysteine ligase
MLKNRKILLGVTGGIAAYKACELTRLMLKAGASVQVVMTEAAARFVGPVTFEALTGRKVALDMFAGEEIGHGHLDLVRDVDLMVIAPATADIIGKLAAGLADDLVSTSVLALTAPLLICPAMNPRMWEQDVVQENVTRLAERGVVVMEPQAGSMAHPAEEPGVGRLPEPVAIFDRICGMLPPQGPLSQIDIIVTAGPTREAVDPVRYLSNYSSGLMGFALADEARRRGAEVHLISGPTMLAPPPGVQLLRVESAADMLQNVRELLRDSRALIMAAAPADFKPRKISPQKIKKENSSDTLALDLDKTPDILKELSREKGTKVFVGFALETENGLQNAQRKLQQKNLDLIVLNHPRPAADAGIGGSLIQGTIVSADGSAENLPAMPKQQMAGLILDRVQDLLATRSTAPTRA